MKIALRIFLISLLANCSQLYAQSGADTIRKDGFNLELLDSLLILEVNVERLLHNEAKMYVSQALMDSSRVQSVWMMKEGKTAYTSARVGQCVLSMDIFINVYTYQSLASLIVEKWMESPGHKSLLMGSFFVYCGTGSDFKKVEGAYELKSTFQVSYYE